MEIISYSDFLEDIKIIFRYIMNIVYSSSPRKENLAIKKDNQLHGQEIYSEILEYNNDCELLQLGQDWKKVKLQYKIALELIPEKSESPLDDIRKSMNKLFFKSDEFNKVYFYSI